MILYFTDRRLNVLGLATTGLAGGYHITSDKKSEDVETGTVTLSAAISFDSGSRQALETMLEAGNYILRDDDGSKEFLTIIDEEVDVENRSISIYAEGSGLDMLNSVVTEYENTSDHNADYYISMIAGGDGFEIGVDESDPAIVKPLSWDSSQTAYERMLDIASEFDLEISFSFDVKGFDVVHKYIDIYKKRGNDLQKELRLGRDVKNITIKKSVANLATALLCYGATDDENGKTTLDGYAYDDGEDFKVEGGLLISRKAVEKWGRFITKDTPEEYKFAGHIVKTFSYDTTDKVELCAAGVAELSKICDTEVNYTVDIARMPEGVSIGDRVNVIDEEGALYLSTRILKLEKSVTSDTYTATLGEFILKDGGVSDQVRQLASEFKMIAETRQLYQWVAYADDASGTNISLDPTGRAYLGIAYNATTSTPAITDPTIYAWSLIKGADGQDGSDGNDGFSPTVAIDGSTPGQKTITITDINGSHSTTIYDGEDGEDGEDGQDGADGKMLYGTTSSAISSSSKVVVISGISSLTLYTGLSVAVCFANGNDTSSLGLNVAGSGLKQVKVNDSTALGDKLTFPAGTTAVFCYDGTYWKYASSDALLNELEWSDSGGLTVRAASGSNSRVNVTNGSVDIYDADGNLGSRTDASGMKAYKNGSQVASFGNTAVIGEAGSAQMVISPDSIYGANGSGIEMFKIESVQLSNSGESVPVYEKAHIGDIEAGGSYSYTIKGASGISATLSGIGVSVRFSPYSDSWTPVTASASFTHGTSGTATGSASPYGSLAFVYDSSAETITIANASWPMYNTDIEVSYASTDTVMSAFTIGTRGLGDVGYSTMCVGESNVAKEGNSVTVGSNLVAWNEQAVFGRYNEEMYPNENAVLIIGNGSQGSRSNAFAFTRYGDTQFEVGSSSDLGSLITSLGWQSDAWVSSSDRVSLKILLQKLLGELYSRKKIFYGTCATAAGTAVKMVTCPTFSSADDLAAGAIIYVKFSNTNTASTSSLKLDVNGTGAKSIKQIVNTGLADLYSAGQIIGGVTYRFVYDGTYWIIDSNCDPSILRFTGQVSMDSAITSTSNRELVRKGDVVQMYLKFTSPSTVSSGQVIGTLPSGFKPVLAYVTSAAVAWENGSNAPVQILASGTIGFVNTAFSASKTYVVCATWATDDAYPS